MKLIFLLVILGISFVQPVWAAGLVPCGGSPRCCDEGEDPGTGLCITGAPPDCEYRCQFCHFFIMADGIVDFFLFTVVPLLAVFMVVVAGGMFILGSGYDAKLINTGRSILISTAIGLLIIYGSWVFINTFFVLIGLANTGLGSGIRDWFQINCPLPPIDG